MQNNIKRIREQNGITRKELAALSGVHYKKITDYENDYIKFENITIGNLNRIATASVLHWMNYVEKIPKISKTTTIEKCGMPKTTYRIFHSFSSFSDSKAFRSKRLISVCKAFPSKASRISLSLFRFSFKPMKRVFCLSYFSWGVKKPLLKFFLANSGKT